MLGGAAGLLVAGPLGALLGGAAGHVLERWLREWLARGSRSLDSPAADPAETRRVAVATATIVLAAKLAKADGAVSVHADDRAYKPLNWMSPPCWVTEGDGEDGLVWVVQNKAGEQLRITVEDVEHDSSHELGVDPGLVKDGVEAHLQALLAEHVELLGAGYTLVRREYPTAIGPVDLLCRDELGHSVAVEIKRRGEIDGVEQLTRYLDLLNRDTVLAPVAGVFAAQQIKPQARTLATDRGIRCVTLDYDQMRGMVNDEYRLF